MIKSDRIYNKIELVIYIVTGSIFVYKYFYFVIHILLYSVHIYFTLRTYSYHKKILKYSHRKEGKPKNTFLK